jgi:ATP-dependent exoDNAse (exonuclease V) beta subunit
VIGVKGNDKAYPFCLLPADEFSSSAKPEYVPDISLSAAPEALTPCRLLHHHGQLKFEAVPERFLTLDEKRRGEFIHRVLFFIDYLKDDFETELQEILTRVKKETGSDYSDEDIKALVIAIVRNEDMESYFTAVPGRLIRKEQDYSDNIGRLFRMDRVIIDNNCVTVIDYKTGKDKESLDKNRAQLKNYMSILSDVYPGKTIEGIVAFVDLTQVESVR